MPDLTRLFKKYVQIIEDNTDPVEREQLANVARKHTNEWDKFESRMLKDTFVSECRDLFYCLRELSRVLNEVTPSYYNETNNKFNNNIGHEKNGNNAIKMTDQDKDNFDTEFRLLLQKYVTKFKQLETYEKERVKLIEDQYISPKSHLSITNFMYSLKHTQLAQFFKTNNQYRSGVLNSINLIIKSISSKFLSMQQERLLNRQKFDTLDFNAETQVKFDTSSDMVYDNIPLSIETSNQGQFVETVQDEVKVYEDTISKLTQEQIQMLQLEHEELLKTKDDQLTNVKKINDAILDIMSLQTELSQHLQVQSQNINNMLDNQEQIESNILKGNIQLKKAQRSASKSAKTITYVALLMAIFILIVDYIN